MCISSISVVIGMFIGNFAYEAFTKKRWERAFEISFFQLIAYLATIIFGDC